MNVISTSLQRFLILSWNILIHLLVAGLCWLVLLVVVFFVSCSKEGLSSKIGFQSSYEDGKIGFMDNSYYSKAIIIPIRNNLSQ